MDAVTHYIQSMGRRRWPLSLWMGDPDSHVIPANESVEGHDNLHTLIELYYPGPMIENHR